MKGIVLAGGTGTRLWPITRATSKQLLPIYDKPLVYYPIATLMDAGIRDILIITTPHDCEHFQNLLKDGSQFGISLTYATQVRPGGLAESFIIGKDFIGEENVALILGDNIFSGYSFFDLAQNVFKDGCHIFTYTVANPSSYGVLTLSGDGQILSLDEKPSHPQSNLAVTGLYFFDKSVVERAKKLEPSARGELEIVDVIKSYMSSNEVSFTNISSGSAWLDTGTPESLHDAASYVRVIEDRTAIKIGCLEEIAFRNSWINSSELKEAIKSLGKNSYSRYLENLLDNH